MDIATTSDGEPRRSGGHFFAIDRRSWAAATALGLNPAVAYIVMACGTGKDNRSTAWSVDAVRRHGGLTLLRSQAAVRLLSAEGFLRLTNDGGKRPRYDLLPAKDIAATNVSRKPPEGEWYLRLLEQVRSGKRIRKGDTLFADRLVADGWLVGSVGAGYAIADAPDERPQWIWLPNSLVLGAGNERPPLRLARETQDVLVLRLLVDLYDGENLAEDGGVSRRLFTRSTTDSKLAIGASTRSGGFVARIGGSTGTASPFAINDPKSRRASKAAISSRGSKR